MSQLSKSAEKLATGAPDLLSFTLTGLKGIGEAYGADSAQTKDAQKLVAKHLDEVKESCCIIMEGCFAKGINAFFFNQEKEL